MTFLFTGGQFSLLPSLVTASVAPTGLAHLMTRLILQLAMIMIVARLGGFVCRRLLKGPSVLGELVAGMLIGPYALGGIGLPGVGALFPAVNGTIPISTELYGIATLASIVLLFLSGLETNVTAFLRYSFAGIVVGSGGLIFSFFFGALCAVWFGIADTIVAPAALFMGIISTATSVGITARILSERRKMATPESVTILAAAVFDDVFGIILLAIVVGMTKAQQTAGSIDWVRIGWLAVKALGFWIVFTVSGIFLAKRVSRVLKQLHSPETIAAVCFGLALLMAGLSEMVGLALIIGAYITGLSLSGTDLVNELQEQLRGLYSFLTPVFFCVMGMLVDFSVMPNVLLFGFVYSVVAILTKLFGCGLPALFMGFNLRGAIRIGTGMVPRAEVGLIIAGIGLSTGAIGQDVFGVAIMLMVLSTLTAPPILVKAFQGGSGRRGGEQVKDDETVEVALAFPSNDIADLDRKSVV